MFALTVGVLKWIHRFSGKRIVLFCDNEAVVHMVNNNSSSCQNCMVLIRVLVLHSLKHNVRVFARYVASRMNYFSDALSRLNFEKFWRLSREKNVRFEAEMTAMPEEIWPMEKIWRH